jgi:hypothetical protein
MSIGPVLAEPGEDNNFQDDYVSRVAEAFARVTGGDLVAELRLDPAMAGKSAWLAKYALLTHRGDAKATLNYGNHFALDLWECDWAQFTATPSAATAPDEDSAARDAMMRQVAEKGFVSGYCGRRASLRGTLFMIEDVTVWRLSNANGDSLGVAALVKRVRRL